METGVIAALSALAGVTVSGGLQILKDHFERRAKGTSIRLQKLEELADRLYQVRESLFATLEAHPTDQERISALAAARASANRTRSLSLLYFPGLRQRTDAFQQAVVAFSLAMQDNNKLPLAAQALRNAAEALEAGIADMAAAILADG